MGIAQTQAEKGGKTNETDIGKQACTTALYRHISWGLLLYLWFADMYDLSGYLIYPPICSFLRNRQKKVVFIKEE